MGALDGRVALVTGASRGIGAAIAERFAAEGARVVVTARTVTPEQSRLPGTISDTVDRILAAGGKAEAIAADLSERDDRVRLAEATGPVDILVNNAAVTYFTPVSEFSDRRFALMFEVQVTAPVHLAQLFAPTMSGEGWILNISSGAARHPAPDSGRRGGTVYGMCKAAIERFSTGLAAELHADGITVNALSPSKVVPTPGTLFHHLTTEDDPKAEPPSVMAAAALALCRPGAPSGRIAYSQEILAELAPN